MRKRVKRRRKMNDSEALEEAQCRDGGVEIQAGGKPGAQSEPQCLDGIHSAHHSKARWRKRTVTSAQPGETFRLTISSGPEKLFTGRSSMFGLSHLFYPWGFIVQAVAIVHFVRRRPENYWFFIIFFGGFLGAGVYIVAEVLPDLGLLRGVFQGFGRKSRIQAVETQILDNPSAANYEELGELYKDQKEFAKAREAFTNAIAARSDSVYTFYYRAQASLGLEDFTATIPDLERVVASDRKFDYYRAAGLLADAYAKTGQLERAEQLYVDVAQFSTTTETLYNYAYFLKLAGRREEAREWAQKLLAKKRTLPRYMQRYERPWFRKGKALLKELETAKVPAEVSPGTQT